MFKAFADGPALASHRLGGPGCRCAGSTHDLLPAPAVGGGGRLRLVTDTMRAARFDAATRTLEVQDVPVPQVGPGDVLVRVEACGICLSDVHLLDGSLPGPLPVVTPGH